MERPLSGWATILLAIVVVAGSSWYAAREHAIDWTLDQVGGTIRLAERTVEIADAADAAKGGRWRFVHLGGAAPDEARCRSAQLYHRAIDRLEAEGRMQDARTVRAHLAFLLADSGRIAEANRELAILTRSAGPCGFCEAMRLPVSGAAADGVPRSLAPLRPGWSATRLESRLLEAAGRVGEAERLRAAAAESAEARFLRMLAVDAVAAILVYVGVLSLAFELRYERWRPRIAAAPPVARWPWSRGLGVFVRSELVGLMLAALVVWQGCGGAISFICLWASFFWFLPVLWLARRHLAGGPWQEFGRDLRLLPAGLTSPQVVRTALGLLTAIWIGGAALEPVLKWLGLDTDMTELYFDPMVMETPPRLFLAGVNAVVWAPLAEELTFRGIVYMTLRTIAGPGVAAGASAALFAAAHLYSLAATVTVFWTGLVFAFAIERYRTLVPALLGHALLNLFFVVSNVVAYR